MRKGDCIYTGKEVEFYPLDPREEEILIEDIGHALSLICRGNGQLACLLHDGSEAYLSDITRPVKKELKEYLIIEDKLQNAIYKKYGIGDLTKEELNLIKSVDDSMLKYEMKYLMNFHEIIGEDLVGNYSLEFVLMSEVEKEFLELFNEIKIYV
ncbi:phosphohydrolase [Clostridium sp.]|uniref:phosphohydrolase n=1 Tax=Clostridium sp. TaxID=1506 RepID=UPI0028FF5797|nr:phosphohydrolase [Clostridium sp.]MDU1310300.1 phosphohydrolase [Clostridium sp.]